MGRNRFILGLVMFALFGAVVFGANLWEQKCEDGTAYMQCSSTKPGYMCIPSGNILVLENVVGEKYPADYPKSDLAGKPTENAVKCACDKFGQVEKNGECVAPTAQQTTTTTQTQTETGKPAVAETPAVETKETQVTTNQNTITTPTTTKANTLSSTGTKTTETPKAKDSIIFGLGAMELVVIAVVISIIGGVGLIGIGLVAAFVIYKMKKRR